jgi:hypothetical protein
VPDPKVVIGGCCACWYCCCCCSKRAEDECGREGDCWCSAEVEEDEHMCRMASFERTLGEGEEWEWLPVPVPESEVVEWELPEVGREEDSFPVL